MDQIRDFIRRFTTPAERLPAGMYTYQTPPSQPEQYRLHLRLEPDGEGVLVVNASTVLHLNQTAAEYAYHLIKSSPDTDISWQVSTRYRVTQDQALADFQDFKDRLLTLIHTPDLDPVTFLNFDRTTPYSKPLSAPLRLDCALTYRTSGGYDPKIAPIDHVRREMSTDEWQTVLQKAWDAGIPHAVFTGGEATMRADLPALTAFAEKLGMVTGLLTDGSRLCDTAYFHELLQAGLDHLLVTLDPAEESGWSCIRDALPEDISLTVHITLNHNNIPSLNASLERLSALGVKAVSLSAGEPGLDEALAAGRKKAAELQMTLVWDVAVPYSSQNPLALETPENSPDGAGQAWMYIEPDGDVLPAQGSSRVLGSFLEDAWDKIAAERAKLA